MSKPRPATIGQIATIMVLAGLLVATDTAAQVPTSSLTSTKLMFASRHRIQSTTDTVTTELQLPSTSKATYVSLASTLVPVAVGTACLWDWGSKATLGAILIGTGVIVGPSIGYFYGDCGGRGAGGIGIRSLTVLSIVVVGAIAAPSNGAMGSIDASAPVCLVGGGLLIFEALRDIAKVKNHVRRRNRLKQASVLNLKPILYADGRTWGMQLSLAL